MMNGYRKKGTKKPEKYGIIFDSVDEIWMYDWILDAKKAGLLESFIYHPESILIVPEYKDNGKVILHKSAYTPDFILFGINKKLKPYFRESIDKKVYIDVKGAYTANHGDLKAFTLITKVLWYLKKIFINKIVMQNLCSQTFVPESIKYTDKKKQLRTAFKGCRSLDEFLRKKD